MSEREETPAEEFSRLVIEYNEGERQNRAEAWNLIADFALEHCDTILRALRAPTPSPAPGVVEALTKARDYIIGLGQSPQAEGWPRDQYAVMSEIETALASLSQPAKGAEGGSGSKENLETAPANPAQVTDATDILRGRIAEIICLETGADENSKGLAQAVERILAAIGAGGQAVQDTWFTDRALPVMAISGDVEDNRVLRLHFRRPVTDDDRKAMCDALNLHQASLSQPHPVDERESGGSVKLTYTNYRGETALRTITPKRIWFGSTEWHPEPQWLLTAYDHDKQADRDFALRDFGTADDRAHGSHRPRRREGVSHGPS